MMVLYTTTEANVYTAIISPNFEEFATAYAGRRKNRTEVADTSNNG